MNSIVAASLFENPLVLVAIVLLGALFNWLMKRRQAGALASSDESKSPPTRGQRERPDRQPDLQDILRQLLRGEPPPAVTPPLIPHAARDEQTFEGDEEELHREQVWPGELEEAAAGLPQSLPQTAEHSRRHTVEVSATATRIAGGNRLENAIRRAVTFGGKAEHPVGAIHATRRRHSSADKRAVRLWHDRQTVRRAFVASLVFAPPKGLEA